MRQPPLQPRHPLTRSLLAVLAIMLVACQTGSPAAPRQTLDFDAGWRFQLGDTPGAQERAFDDTGWRVLDLPHDWSIEGPFSESNPAGAEGGALPGGIGWYRKSFHVAASAQDRLTFIEFDGVYRNSEVWINGQRLGKRPYGYSSFRYELTPHLRSGDAANILAVRVDNSEQPNSRWYSGSGIYRHVRLVTTDPVHIAHWGTYITTPEVTPGLARVAVRTTVRNATAQDRPIAVRVTLFDASGREAAAGAADGRVPPDSALELDLELVVTNPSLWSPDRPDLYRAVTRLECADRLCDETETPFGIRTFAFDPERGFLLNGTRLEIRGVNQHHDLGALGAALNGRALQRQLEILKEMGVNAIRASHNPPAPELLDLTDRMGFLVMDEAFDVWKLPKRPFDYHLDWDAWHERDLADMVLRDRNHPSIVAWSIGNEVPEQGDSSGLAITRELAGIVRRLDPTRPVAAGLDRLESTNFVIESGALDLIGYNYRHHLWAAFPATHPGLAFVATEAASSLNSRGHYDQPSDSVARYGGDWMPGPAPDADYRLSAYDNRAAAWGSLHRESLREIARGDFLSGMFLWTGFDYLGEPTPHGWPARSSYFGVIDLAGFPKDAFFLYQSQWTTRPVLHVFPHWNWSPGQLIDVWAYTNLDTVELFLNDVSLGVRAEEPGVMHRMWRVPFAPGTLRAEARTGGRVVATREVRTAGPAARLELVPDRATIVADGRDLSFVTVNVLDRAGIPVPDADLRVRFRVDGAARIVAVDAGDPISHAPFQADSVRAYNGKALVVIGALREAGPVTVTAMAEGLASATTRLVLAAPGTTGPDRR